MKLLSIDTTDNIMDVALSSKGEFISLSEDVRINDYEGIVLLIEKALKKSKLRLDKIDHFGVCTGPGSFTGIRIGLSVMKALAYSANKPLIGFNSLDLLARIVKDKFSGSLCVIQDAKRKNIYSAIYNKNKNLSRISPYLLVDIDSLLKKIKALHQKDEDLYFYGNVTLLYQDDIKKLFPNSKILHDSDTKLKAEAIISLTKHNIIKKSNAFKLLPFYMYPKDCQVSKPIK
ncbi:MAG: tRNA (adenosine(37)-N6)-threonylcarbamoyltransferase complex dimerization subunit type 1 TsaB [Candidatus Omnitrophota bacterium]